MRRGGRGRVGRGCCHLVEARHKCAHEALGLQVGGTAVFAKFSRADEIQADEGGFRNVIAAGINPRGMLTFFQKLLSEEQSGSGGNASAWFSDHPGTQDRIADIQRMLNDNAGRINGLRTDSQGFQRLRPLRKPCRVE